VVVHVAGIERCGALRPDLSDPICGLSAPPELVTHPQAIHSTRGGSHAKGLCEVRLVRRVPVESLADELAEVYGKVAEEWTRLE
jgi:hypothetical protein